jgi:hypothetical protein
MGKIGKEIFKPKLRYGACDIVTRQGKALPEPGDADLTKPSR